MFGAADLVAVPSRFEPCGLVQMYAQRYGALPVAHATGGLKDTIVDCDAKLETGTGFLFEEPTADALLGATERAIAVGVEYGYGLRFGRPDLLVRAPVVFDHAGVRTSDATRDAR